MAKATCPICGGTVEVPDDAIPGEIVEHECGVALEVVMGEGGLQLKLLEDVGEDWGE